MLEPELGRSAEPEPELEPGPGELGRQLGRSLTAVENQLARAAAGAAEPAHDMAQNRYKRLVMAAEAGQRTVPANEVVFREVNAEKHLGHDRVAPHYVPEEERIPQTIAETRRTHMSVGGGPFSDKMNNMYMQNWHQASYPFVKDRHLKPWNAPEGIHAAEASWNFWKPIRVLGARGTTPRERGRKLAAGRRSVRRRRRARARR